MGMPALFHPPYWTTELVRELPEDGNRFECIDGELLVTPSPLNIHLDLPALFDAIPEQFHTP